jgi:hypothetical protein
MSRLHRVLRPRMSTRSTKLERQLESLTDAAVARQIPVAFDSASLARFAHEDCSMITQASLVYCTFDCMRKRIDLDVRVFACARTPGSRYH